MELNINEININRYANGELIGEELKAFEALLQQDEALREKIESHQFMDAVLYKNVVKVDEEEQITLEPLFNNLGAKYFSEKKPKPNRIRRLLPFAALAAAAALLLFLFIPNTENGLYTKYFEMPNNQSKMGSDDPSVFDKANMAYNSQDYKQAIAYYNEHLSKDPMDPKALEFKGGAELALNRTDTAISTFQKLVENRRYANKANWYLALGNLKKGEKVKTEKYLNLIPSDDKIYHDKAQQLLKEL